MAEDAFQKSFSTKPKTDTVQSTGEKNANNTNTATTADANSAASATSAVTSTHNAGNSKAAAANNAKSVQSKGTARGRSELDVKVAKIDRDGAQNEN